jgi:ABC-type multidrug transport system fused ATPase/permease subunit
MKQINKILLQEVKPFGLQLIFILLLIFFGVALESVAPWSFKLLIDNVLNGEELNPSGWFGKIFLFFF